MVQYVTLGLIVEITVSITILPILCMSLVTKVLNHSAEGIQEFRVNDLSVSLKVRSRLRTHCLIICGAEISFRENIQKEHMLQILQNVEKSFRDVCQRFTFEISIIPKNGVIEGYLLLYKDIKSDNLAVDSETVALQKLEKFINTIQAQIKKGSYKIITGPELISIIFNLLKLKKGHHKFARGEKRYLKITDEKGMSKYFTVFKKLKCKKEDDIRNVISKIFDLSTVTQVTFILSKRFAKNSKIFPITKYVQLITLTTIVEGTINPKKQRDIGTIIGGHFLKKHIFDLLTRKLFFKLSRIDFKDGSAIITEAISESLNRFDKNKEKSKDRPDGGVEDTLKNFIWIGGLTKEGHKGNKEIRRVNIEELLRLKVTPNIIYTVLAALFEIPNNAAEKEKNKELVERCFNALKDDFLKILSLSQSRREGILYVLKRLLFYSNYLSEEKRLFVRKVIKKIESNQPIIVRNIDDSLVFDLSGVIKDEFDSYEVFMSFFNLLLIGIDYNIDKKFNVEDLLRGYYIDRFPDISPTVLRFLLYSKKKEILTKKNKRTLEYMQNFIDFPVLVRLKIEKKNLKEYLVISRKEKGTSQIYSFHESFKKRKNNSQSSKKYVTHLSKNQEPQTTHEILKLQNYLLEYIRKNSVVSWEDIRNGFSNDLKSLEVALNSLVRSKTIQKIKIHFEDFSTTLFYNNSILRVSPVEMYMMKKFIDICNEIGVIIDFSPHLKSVVVIEDYFVVFFMESIKKYSLQENLLFVKSNGFDKILLITPVSDTSAFSKVCTMSSELNIDLNVLPFDYQRIYSFLKNLVKEKRTLQKV